MRKASMMSYAKGGLFSPKTGEAGEAYVQKLINKTVGTIPKKTFKDPKYVGYKPKYKF